MLLTLHPALRAAAVLLPQHQAVTFRVKCPTAFGQRLWLVGDHASLGGWDTRRWVKMRWSEGDVWAATVELDGPAGSVVSYKVRCCGRASGCGCLPSLPHMPKRTRSWHCTCTLLAHACLLLLLAGGVA